MSGQEELISQFKDVTGTSEERARFYLESSNWTLQLAISSFYESEQEVDSSEMNQPEPTITEVKSVSSPTLFPQSLTSQESKSGKNSKDDNSKFSSKPKIATLKNMAQLSSDEEEGQAFYAGGSERSGQQVLGPPKKKNFKEQLTEMFRLAQESGAVVDPSNQPSTSSSRSDLYHGPGLRLGQTESDHQLVAGSDRPSRPNNIEPVILKLWSQGFSINDGDLRPYNEPDNKEFLDSVMKGQIPNELRQMGNMVSVDLEDHRHQDFKKPVTKIKTFKGSGHTLGSPAPNIEVSIPSMPVLAGSSEDNQKRAVEELKVKANEPTTMIQIRLADGSRISGQFNISHTIDDIRQYIITSRPQYENQRFILVTSFPTKELIDGSQTIESAGLLNASLMQRLK